MNYLLHFPVLDALAINAVRPDIFKPSPRQSVWVGRMTSQQMVDAIEQLEAHSDPDTDLPDAHHRLSVLAAALSPL